MSASSKKHGWMEEMKKSSSKKNIFENIEKDRFLSTTTTSPVEKHIPEIEDFISEETIEHVPKTTFKKELNVDVLKNTSVNLDTMDLTILTDVLEPETEDEEKEKDEVWNWHQLFTKVTAEIADEK